MLPRTFLNRRVEVLVTPVEDAVMQPSVNVVQNALEDAKTRFKVVHGKPFDCNVSERFLMQLNQLAYSEPPLISLREDSIKVTMFYNGQKYIIDYKTDCPDIIMLSKWEADTCGKRMLVITEVSVDKLTDCFGGGH